MKLVADANVLLSAVLGGRAALVLSNPGIEEVLTTAVTFAEVQEYALRLCGKKRISEDKLLLTVAALPVTFVAAEKYQSAMKRARQLMEARDPDDVELLALAIHAHVPL